MADAIPEVPRKKLTKENAHEIRGVWGLTGE